MTDCAKHSSLIQYTINNDCKKLDCLIFVPALVTNIGQAMKWLTMTYTLAYYYVELIIIVKS